jgi:hypothetical protein
MATAAVAYPAALSRKSNPPRLKWIDAVVSVNATMPTVSRTPVVRLLDWEAVNTSGTSGQC